MILLQLKDRNSAINMIEPSTYITMTTLILLTDPFNPKGWKSYHCQGYYMISFFSGLVLTIHYNLGKWQKTNKENSIAVQFGSAVENFKRLNMIMFIPVTTSKPEACLNSMLNRIALQQKELLVLISISRLSIGSGWKISPQWFRNIKLFGIRTYVPSTI